MATPESEREVRQNGLSAVRNTPPPLGMQQVVWWGGGGWWLGGWWLGGWLAGLLVAWWLAGVQDIGFDVRTYGI